MSDKQIEDLKALVEDTVIEAQKLKDFCRVKHDIFGRVKNVTHNWSKWETSGHIYNDHARTSLIALILKRNCKRCGLIETVRTPYGETKL